MGFRHFPWTGVVASGRSVDQKELCFGKKVVMFFFGFDQASVSLQPFDTHLEVGIFEIAARRHPVRPFSALTVSLPESFQDRVQVFGRDVRVLKKLFRALNELGTFQSGAALSLSDLGGARFVIHIRMDASFTPSCVELAVNGAESIEAVYSLVECGCEFRIIRKSELHRIGA